MGPAQGRRILTISVDSKHPAYTQFLPDWILMGHTNSGERTIKNNRETYLPTTSGMRQDGMNNGQMGRAAYDAYLTRAFYPSVVNDAVEAMIGVMHHKPPKIDLPAALEPMRERATVHSESMEMLLRRINEGQLIDGRIGLLLDLPGVSVIGSVKPYIATYKAQDILNWDDGRREVLVAQNLNMVALNESEFERKNDFEWEFEGKTRMLILGDPNTNQPKGEGVYQVALFNANDTNFNAADLVMPSIAGNFLDKIPFIFINSKDVVPMPDKPPLLGLANLALAIYRGEADYRQALFMEGQDTLVIIGDTTDENRRTGANASINLPIGGDAKYIGVNSMGLIEMRQSLENDRAAADQRGGALLDSDSREKESGDALKIRVAARTATLNQIALAGAFGLEQLLKIAAEWMGADPEQVSVTPNLDFAGDELASRSLLELATAKGMGAPISNRTIHDQMSEKDLTKLTFEEELAEIEKDAELMLSIGTNAPGPIEDEETGTGDQ